MKITGAIGLAMLLFVAVNLPPIAAASLAHHFLNMGRGAIVPIVVGGMLFMALLAIFFFVRFGDMNFADFGFRFAPPRYVVWAVIFGIALGLLTQICANWVHDKNPANLAGQSQLMIYLYVALLGPAEEEIVFRGLLQSILTTRLRNTAVSARASIIAIVIVSILFALMHLQLGLFTAVGTLLVGLTLGEFRRRSDSLLPCVLCHMAVNAAGLLVG